MNLKDIQENLCAYDKRNPNYIESTEKSKEKNKQCYCDNCFMVEQN